MEKNTLLKLCEDKNVPAGPINTMEEVFKDPQVISREMELNFKNVRGVASPFKFFDAKLKMQAPSLSWARMIVSFKVSFKFL